jgi:hypothetical protein
MRRRIVEHHMLNGTAFSSVEFLFAGAAAAAIAAAALWHRHWWWATALCGAVNCLVVASFAMRMRRRGETGGQIRDLLDTEVRQRIARTHPHLLSDMNRPGRSGDWCVPGSAASRFLDSGA